MIVDSLINPQSALAPRGLAGLITLYESNFLRLKLLWPDVATTTSQRLSSVYGDCDLQVRVVEKAPYTSTLSMSYLFSDGSRTISEPDITIRVYFDAQIAEAMQVGSRYATQISDSFGFDPLDKSLDARWVRNAFLNKWLEYCYDRGHLLLR